MPQHSFHSQSDRTSNRATRLSDDFRALILDHASHPRHYGMLADANRSGEAQNPLCGDRYRVFVKLAETKIEAIRFTGTGCSVSMASASMMAEVAEHLRLQEVHALIEQFCALFTQVTTNSMDDSLGDLVAFAGLRRNPLRSKCVTLPWDALEMALRRDPDDGVDVLGS